MKRPMVEKVTPKQALKILESNSVNRPISDTWVADFAHRMRIGAWALSPDPICIGKDGEVYNGQHRLWAVVMAKTPQEFWVYRDCDAEIIKVIDAGRSRSLCDRVNVSGNRMNSRHLAIVKGFYTLPDNTKIDWTVDTVEAAEKKARPHIVFAESALKARDQRMRLSCSSFVVAMARAHMEEITEVELCGFARVFCNGDPSEVRGEEVDSYVRRLRDKIIQDRVGPVQKKYQGEYYLILAKAIQNYIDGDAPQKIYKPDCDPFPLRKTYRGIVTTSTVEKCERSPREWQHEILADANGE